MQNRFMRSKRELRGPNNDLDVHPSSSRTGDSAPVCGRNPMVTTKQAGGRAEGASRGGPGE
eukprot:548275-Alexandrium_andersonii.AAC.1